MLSRNLIDQTIEDFNENKRHQTFAEFIANIYKDKVIELYMGDSFETISLEQSSMDMPSVVVGKVISAYKECLIINSPRETDNGIVYDNTIFVSERAIRMISEVDGNGGLDDCFNRSKYTIKNFFKKI